MKNVTRLGFAEIGLLVTGILGIYFLHLWNREDSAPKTIATNIQPISISRPTYSPPKHLTIPHPYIPPAPVLQSPHSIRLSSSLGKRIMLNTEHFIAALEKNNSATATWWLHPQFAFRELSGREARVTVAETVWNWRDAKIMIHNTHLRFDGKIVELTTQYYMEFRPSDRQPLSIRRGRLVLQWRRCDKDWCEGQWKIVYGRGLCFGY